MLDIVMLSKIYIFLYNRVILESFGVIPDLANLHFAKFFFNLILHNIT